LFRSIHIGARFPKLRAQFLLSLAHKSKDNRYFRRGTTIGVSGAGTLGSMSLPIDEHVNAVKTVVVPAAGLGTRFLPATKTVPKELLPVVDTPGIELIAAEAAELGATRLVIITAPNKAGVLAHFEHSSELEETLMERGKTDQVEIIRRAADLIKAV